MSSKGYVYCLFDAKNNICRIGRTAIDTEKCRISTQLAYYPFALEPHKYLFNNSVAAEVFLHRFFKSKKLNGDWYNIKVSDFNRSVIEYKRNLFKKTPSERIFSEATDFRVARKIVLSVYPSALVIKHSKKISGTGKINYSIMVLSGKTNGYVELCSGETKQGAWNAGAVIVNGNRINKYPEKIVKK